METISHRELRNNSAEVLRRVANGETFEITNHGEVAAMLIPPPDLPMDRLRAAGKVRPPTDDARIDLRKIERGRSTTSTQDIIDDVRGAW